MSFFDPQNPGFELGNSNFTTTEENTLIALADGLELYTGLSADRILFWDESANAFGFLEAGSGLSISGTTITATGSGVDLYVTVGDSTTDFPVASYADVGDAINAAYASLPAAGGGIFVQTGSYQFTTPIVFNTTGKYVTLRGAGGTATYLIFTPTSGTAIRYDCGDPTGHIIYEITGFTLMGKTTLIAAGQANANTSVGIFYGGTDATGGGGNGAVGINTHNMNVNGFGTNWEIGADAYMLSFNHCSNSGGNGGQASRGSLVHIKAAANSGERNNFLDCTFTDPGNSDPDNAIYITSGGTASNNFINCSIDNVQIRVGASNGTTNIISNHFENAGTGGIYGDYIVILGVSSDSSTHINLIGNEFANSSGVNTWTTIVSHGGALYAAGNHIDNYNGRTVTNFIMHDLNNGTSSDYVVRTSIQGGGLTNIIGGSGGVTYSLATASTAIFNTSNSYTIGLRANGSNTNDFFSGNTTVGGFDHEGDWTFGVNTSSTAVFSGSVTVSTSLLPDANDGAVLGSSTLQFSDLFLAEGGVINWDNGDATLTQVGDVLTLAGADLKITTPGNASTSVITTDGTQTMTNKRITKRVVTVNAPGATPSTNIDNGDIFEFTGLATAITSMTTNLTGTPVNGQMVEIIFVDDGTARGITWGSSFANGGLVNLPTTTVISTVLRVLLQYQTIATLNKWVCIAVA